MAIPTIRSTFVLDLESAESLERLAREWDVSKSAALRRAIKAAASAGVPDDRVEAFRRLQRAVGLTPAGARRWGAEVRSERRASGARRKGPRR